MDTINHEDLVAGLRGWARGSAPMAAGIELLLRVGHGAFAQPGAPWITTGPSGEVWVDVDQLRTTTGLSGGERRVLSVVAALLDDGPINLADVITGLDRHQLHLMLAALAAAARSHDDVDVALDPDGTTRLHPAGPLVSWPS